MKILWHVLLIVSALLVIVNFENAVNLDINKFIGSLQSLDFKSDYIDDFRKCADYIGQMSDSEGFWDSMVNFFKSTWSLLTAIFKLLFNSIYNIAMILTWLLGFGFNLSGQQPL